MFCCKFTEFFWIHLTDLYVFYLIELFGVHRWNDFIIHTQLSFLPNVMASSQFGGRIAVLSAKLLYCITGFHGHLESFHALHCVWGEEWEEKPYTIIVFVTITSNIIHAVFDFLESRYFWCLARVRSEDSSIVLVLAVIGSGEDCYARWVPFDALP